MYTVYNSSRTIVKQASSEEVAVKMAKQLASVFGEQFSIERAYDIWAQNFDR